MFNFCINSVVLSAAVFYGPESSVKKTLDEPSGSGG